MDNCQTRINLSGICGDSYTMKHFTHILLVFLLINLSCTIVAPGYNSTDVVYEIIFTAKNQTDDTLVAIAEIDTISIKPGRTYVWSDKFTWVEDNNDKDSATMLEVAEYFLTTNINFFNNTDSLVASYLIKPSAKAGDRIPAANLDLIEGVLGNE